MGDYKAFYKNKIVLVTGGAGSIGTELCKKLMDYDIKTLRILDNNETGLFELQEQLNDNRVRILIGDVRDKNRLFRAIDGVHIVFHVAALKHVPLCEYNPFEAINTNIIGTQNLIEAAIDKNIQKFILISSDKAVNPINVMGATKLLAEKLTIAANIYKGPCKCIFSCVRFGNVLGTRGSVLPTFKDQINNFRSITLTNPNMTRFMMSIDEAVRLVLKATTDAQGGEIFILKMPAIKMGEFAQIFIDEYSKKMDINNKQIKIKITGSRIGEKLHEELLFEHEKQLLHNTNEMYVINYITKEKKIGLKHNNITISSNNRNSISNIQIKKMIIRMINQL